MDRTQLPSYCASCPQGLSLPGPGTTSLVSSGGVLDSWLSPVLRPTSPECYPLRVGGWWSRCTPVPPLVALAGLAMPGLASWHCPHWEHASLASNHTSLFVLPGSGLCYVRSLVPSTLVCAMLSQIALWLFLGDGLMSPSMFVCHQSQGRSGLL